MSESYCQVVQIDKVGKHPNADKLEITQVMNAYPCIFQSGQFKEGDKAVYVSVDMLVPLIDDRWAFLRDPERPKQRAKIKAKKLRGIFSMGILTKADPSWEVGQDVAEQLNIEKYEPPSELGTGGECEKDPGFIPVYTDIEGLRKYKSHLVVGEEVIMTEKIDGANTRFVWRSPLKDESEGRLWVGSHKQIKRYDVNNIWWRAAKEYQLDTILKQAPDKIFYGEVYGQVQDLRYGSTNAKPLRLAFFDIFDIAQGKYMDFHAMKNLLIALGLEMVPMLYIGPWSEDLMAMCNGKTTIFPHKHCREGFVVRPTTERWDAYCGRIIFKMIGETYLLRKQDD